MELCTALFYAIIPTLFPCLLLICYPYILLHFNVLVSFSHSKLKQRYTKYPHATILVCTLTLQVLAALEIEITAIDLWEWFLVGVINVGVQ